VALLIRTSDLPAGRRRQAWREVVCETLGPLEMRSDPDEPLEGQIEAGAVGAIGVGRIRTTTRHSVHRTEALVRRDSPQLHRLVLAVEGRPRIEQAGCSHELRPGEFAVYDFARPYELAYESPVELAVFSFPAGTLALPPDTLAQLAAVPIRGDAGASALAAGLLHRVAVEHDSYRPASADRLATVAADLVVAALAERLDEPDIVPVASQDRTLVLRIHAFIDRHLGDVDLDPAAIAAAHHVSLRHLHRLFESESTTVAAWVRQRRLERCRRDLVDPALHARPVSELAARWGLPDPTHFSRLFRRTYGQAPSDYRRAHLHVPT
jgi:AraC-like DNA-binding protein